MCVNSMSPSVHALLASSGIIISVSRRFVVPTIPFLLSLWTTIYGRRFGKASPKVSSRVNWAPVAASVGGSGGGVG